jgi:RNA polymerase sigma factor (sigma-70 family)
MKKGWELTPAAFDLFLSWLSNDRDVAAERYEQIRQRLIRIFAVRGCPDPEFLADETLNRVTVKLPSIIDTYEGEPIRYIYNVARKIHLESLSRPNTREEQFDPVHHDRAVRARTVDDADQDQLLALLEECLENMPSRSRELILEYFRADAGKSKVRQTIAERAGWTINTLRIRVLRIKKTLADCLAAKRQSVLA